MAKKKKVIKRKIKWASVLKLILLIILGVIIWNTLISLPTNHIVIKGNTILKDIDIIRQIGYEEYPPLFTHSNSEIKTSLLENDFVISAKIKKNLSGVLTVEIEEAKPLFYNRDKNRLVLSNKKEIEPDKLYGVPVLTNYVPDTIYDRLITSFASIPDNIIGLISEVIYDPWKNGNTMIDDTRFFLNMNDGNHVYTNLIHFDKLNNYIEIYSTLENKKGTLYLDSSSDKISFSLF